MTEQQQREAAVLALGDQVQQVCNASGLGVLGYLVVVAGPDGFIQVEARSQVEQQTFMDMLRAYLAAEAEARAGG